MPHPLPTGTDSLFLSGAVLLFVAGAITFVVAALGIVAAIGLWRPLLAIYIAVVVVLVILEIAAGILGFIFRDEIIQTQTQTRNDEIEIDERAIKDYRNPQDSDFQQDVNDAVDFVQEEFECCGINNATDWYTFNFNFTVLNNGPPFSCICNLDEDGCTNFTVTTEFTDPATGITFPVTQQFNAWDTGCINETQDDLEDLALVLASLGIAFGGFEIIGIVIAFALICCITASNKDTFV